MPTDEGLIGAWRALFVALHDAKEAGVDPETAIDRVKHETAINWSRNDSFFKGSLLDVDPDTGKLTGRSCPAGRTSMPRPTS